MYWMAVYHDLNAWMTESVAVLLPLASEMEIDHLHS